AALLVLAVVVTLATPMSASAKRASTTTTLTCSVTSVTVNVSLSCTATVANVAGSRTTPPTGTVTFSGPAGGGAFQPATCTLSTGSCSTSYTPAPGSEGTQTLTATYVSDTGNSSSTDSRTIKVLQRPASVSIVCSPTTVFLGETTSCSAQVA